MEDKFITLAIHTSQHAMAAKRILEAHNIMVRLQKFMMSGSSIVVGVRVMIQERDLPLALKVTESLEHLNSFSGDAFFAHQGDLLIPVDFNDYCMEACRAGFDIADRLDLRPVILHAYPSPIFNASLSLDDMTGISDDLSFEEEYSDISISRDLQKQARHRMKELQKKIKDSQNKGEIPDLEFKVVLEDGVAEDVIKEYCRMTPPSLVVMVTRGKKKKGEQLIGSVTAEVLDDCKVPVFSFPENCDFMGINKIKEIVFFCNMDQHDLICVDTFMRMFDYPEVNITLIPMKDKEDKSLKGKLLQLRDYFSKTYPAAEFSTAIFPSKTFMLDFYHYESQRGTEMIVVPNRRKNALMRLFNPGIAHRLLFERDLPLLALPI